MDSAGSKMIDSLTTALWDTKMVSARLLLGLSELFWAIGLLWPGTTFSRPTYTYMAKVAPEEAWGLVFFLSAVIQFTILLRRDFHCWGARYFAAWNMVLWVYTVASMYLSVYPPPAAISGETALAMAAFWIWFRPFMLLKGYERAVRATSHITAPAKL